VNTYLGGSKSVDPAEGRSAIQGHAVHSSAISKKRPQVVTSKPAKEGSKRRRRTAWFSPVEAARPVFRFRAKQALRLLDFTTN
jgi:hypothetical protein